MIVTLHDERGMTLIELLVAMVVATAVLTAAFTLIEQALPATARITARVDAQQRGREALEQVERDLGSAICVPTVDASGNPTYLSPLTSPSDGNDVTFFTQVPTATDVATNTTTLQLRQLQYTGGAIVEKRWNAPLTGTPPAVNPNNPFPDPAATLATTPALTRRVVGNVRPNGAAQIFSYEAYDATTGVLGPLAAGAVGSTDLPRIVEVDFNFVVGPSSAPAGAATPQDATLTDQVSIPLPVDFTDTTSMAKGPQCARS